MDKLTHEVHVADFQEHLDMEIECYRNYNPSFKMRHFKKMLKKMVAGVVLSRNEWIYSPDNQEPMYDMDGGYFHNDQPVGDEDWGNSFTGYAPKEGT